MKGFGRHLSYANVVATMALVFAMGGSAVAARHYLITSTGQISPRVLSALKAARVTGKEGPAGKEGAPGKEGAAGKNGANGTNGAEGARGEQGQKGERGEGGASGSGLSKAELETLKSILPYVKFVASGVGGKPTIQFSGANVQVVDGAGHNTPVNGAGNLVIGYDEEPGTQSGSHDLVMGTKKQSYTNYGSVLGGSENTASGALTTVFGQQDLASGEWDSVVGGNRNEAGGENSVVAGGERDRATGNFSSVTGGENNLASGEWAAVSGGKENIASAKYSAILGTKAKTEATEFGTYPTAP